MLENSPQALFGYAHESDCAIDDNQLRDWSSWTAMSTFWSVQLMLLRCLGEHLCRLWEPLRKLQGLLGGWSGACGTQKCAGRGPGRSSDRS